MTPQEVIKLIKECGLNIEQPLHDIVVDYLIALLEKQIPKKPIRFHEEYDKHEWKRNPDGSIDEEAWECGIHEGVECERCGEQFCTACDKDYDTYKCVVDKAFCPTCNSKVSAKRCSKCNQLIDWRKEDV